MPANPAESQRVIETYLHPDNLTPLVKGQLDENISKDLETFDGEGKADLIARIFEDLKRDDEIVDQNMRDAALELLNRIDMADVPKDQLITAYARAVKSMPLDADVYGPKDSLLQAGVLVAKQLPGTAVVQDVIMNAWEPHIEHQASNRRTNIDAGYLYEGQSQILNNLLPETEGTVRLGNREEPPMAAEIKILHDEYLRVVRESVQFKLALWDNTPEFRELCLRNGVRLEDFWNLRDSDRVANEVEELIMSPQISDRAREAFSRALKSVAGLELQQLDRGTVRILADQMIDAARIAQAELASKIDNSFDGKIEGFRTQIAEAAANPQKAQKLIAPIKGFFTAMGVKNASELSLDQIQRALYDQQFMQQASLYFANRNIGWQQAIDQLEKLFKPANYDNGFSLMARTREDLFLGDLTGDCTAYHLNTGVNGWTVPVWLSNPGFNFFKIDGGKTAKLGLLLAVADGQPVLVVDSIEVGSEITDEEHAKKRIHDGFAYLQDWANAIGLKVQLLNNITNSSELGDIMTQELTKSSKFGKVEALGGVSGIAELRKNLTGTQAKETIYLQSAADLASEEDLLTLEQTELLQVFETYISTALDESDDKQIKPFETALKNADWSEVFKYLVTIHSPNISSVLGQKWEDLQRIQTIEGRIKYLDDIRVIFGLESMHNYTSGSLKLDTITEEWLENEAKTELQNALTSRREQWEALSYEQQQAQLGASLRADPRMKEATLYSEIIDLIAEMYDKNFTPEEALRILYTAKEIEDNLTLPLYRGMDALKNLQQRW